MVRRLGARARRGRARGFTLTELMVVVAITGVLATVGISLLNRHLRASKAGEAYAGVQAIRAAQERWRAETQSYLNVSTNLESWYPMGKPGKTRYHFDQPSGPDYQRWQLLNPTVAGPVQFGYATIAGSAGQAVPPLSVVDQPVFPVPNEPWYVIQARADVDENGVFATFAATSFTGEVYAENIGE
jgi:prepilin-type N-terminal cleavage/methylation domain-containing protein